MPWYEPVARPPNPPRYHPRADAQNGVGGRNHHNQWDAVGDPSNTDVGAWGGDELQRRLEAMISPMLSSAALASQQHGADTRPTHFSGSTSLPYGSLQSPYPHPSFRHRERSIDTSRVQGEAAQFFYPHAVTVGRRILSPIDDERAASSTSSTTAITRCTADRASRADAALQTNEEENCGENVTGTGAEVSGNDAILLEKSENDHRDRGEFRNQYDNSRYNGNSRPETGSSKQLTLAQDPNSGNMFCTPPPEPTTGCEQSWDDVGKIGKYQGQQPEDESKRRPKQRDDKGGTKKKKKNKRTKKDKMDGSAAAALPSAGNRKSPSRESQPHSDHDSDFETKKQGGVTKAKGKKRPRKSKTSKKPAMLGYECKFDEASFAGIEECEFMNAGLDDACLQEFLRKVKARKIIAWTMVFLDSHCTTPFLPTSKKYCTEKGPRCKSWNCTCDLQIRAMQAAVPILGVMMSIPATQEEDYAATFILPLGPAVDPDFPEGFERMTLWPTTPFLCNTQINQRWSALTSILVDRNITKVTYCAELGLMPFHFHRTRDIDGGSDVSHHAQMDLILPGIWDLRLASWLLLPHSKDDDLEFETMRDGFPHLIKKLPKYTQPEVLSSQLQGLITARQNLELLLLLHPIIDQRISDKGIRAAFDDIEGPLQSVLSAMECTGIGFRPSRLIGIQRKLELKIEGLVHDARSISKDSTFLLSSPQQVSHLLFDIMKITVPKGLSTKKAAGSQHRSTSEEALKAIQSEAERKGSRHRIIDIILEFRAHSKMLTTYVRPLPNFARELASGKQGHRAGRKRSRKQVKEEKSKVMRIHPMWMQTAVRTGRLSCRKPNMQQIPTGGVLGVNPRDSFTISSPGKCLVTADYSQKEIRILAHMSNDDTLLAMFRSTEEVDIYKQMASACCGKPVQSVSDEERRIYKQVTLAVLYGMGVPQVAKKLNVNRSTALKFLDSFFRRFQGVQRWIEATKEFARRHQYVKTISGRRRYLDEIHSDDKGKRAQAERQAVNTIIQGSAADIMKLAMLKMSARIMDWKLEGLDSPGGSGVPPTILLQIHDELLFETNANEIDVKMLRDAIMRCCAEECMREFNLKVQLKLKCMYGLSWGSMKEM